MEKSEYLWAKELAAHLYYSDSGNARYRKALDWDGQISCSFNPEKVKKWRAEIPPSDSEVCSMCGEFCAMRTVEKALKK